MMLIVAIGLFLIDLAVFGLLSFAKLELLRTMIFGFLAFVYHRFDAKRILIAVVVFVSAFTMAQPFVHYGRAQVEKISGAEKRATFDERLRITMDYFEGAAEKNPTWESDQQTFLRLSYVNVGAFVINEYDAGRPGTSMRYALVAIVPRVLWPDKPATGLLGAELYELIRGHDGTSVSAGYFAETYWNLGPLLMFAVFSPVGVLFAFISRYAFNAINSGNWFQFPAILMSVQMGIRSDGHFATDIMGAAAIFFVIAIVLGISEQWLFRNSRYRRKHPNPLARSKIV
jgi:hypothetical protein